MSENPMNKHSGTDWARIDAMTDDDHLLSDQKQAYTGASASGALRLL